MTILASAMLAKATSKALKRLRRVRKRYVADNASWQDNDLQDALVAYCESLHDLVQVAEENQHVAAIEALPCVLCQGHASALALSARPESEFCVNCGAWAAKECIDKSLAQLAEFRANPLSTVHDYPQAFPVQGGGWAHCNACLQQSKVKKLNMLVRKSKSELRDEGSLSAATAREVVSVFNPYAALQHPDIVDKEELIRNLTMFSDAKDFVAE